MQAWDAVKTTGAESIKPELQNRAGLIVRVDVAKEIATVKLDATPETDERKALPEVTEAFSFEELVRLG